MVSIPVQHPRKDQMVDIWTAIAFMVWFGIVVFIVVAATTGGLLICRVAKALGVSRRCVAIIVALLFVITSVEVFLRKHY